MKADVKAIAQKWAGRWSTGTAAEFSAMYAEDAAYIDHAFCIARSGHEKIETHFNIWKTSIPDFVMEIERADTTEAGVILRYVGRGTFIHDLPRVHGTGRGSCSAEP